MTLVKRFIAFDLDGTLVDADALHKTALNHALAHVAQFALSENEHLATFKGLPTKRKLAMLVEAGRLTRDQADEVARWKQEFTVGAIRQQVLPDPTKVELLRTLVQNDWRVCVASNAVRESVGLMLKAADLKPFVEFFLSNEDAKPKPAPDIYLRAAERLGCLPCQLVAVEDARPGKMAALSAGCRLVGVDGPAEVHPGLLARIYAAAGHPFRKPSADGGTYLAAPRQEEDRWTHFTCWKCGLILRSYPGEYLAVLDAETCMRCGEWNVLEWSFPRSRVIQ